MKFKVNIELEKNEIERDYRRKFLSLFKHVLTKMDNNIMNDFYSDSKKDKVHKNRNLCFSVRFDNPQKKNLNSLSLDSTKAKLYVSSDNDENVGILLGGFLNCMNETWQGITVKKVELVKEIIKKDNMCVFKIESPIVLRKHVRTSNHDKFITCQDKEFVVELVDALKRDMVNNHKEDLLKEVENMDIQFVQLKPTADIHYHKCINGTKGIMLVSADNDLIRYIQKHNIGSLRNSGFGMLSVMG